MIRFPLRLFRIYNILYTYANNLQPFNRKSYFMTVCQILECSVQTILYLYCYNPDPHNLPKNSDFGRSGDWICPPLNSLVPPPPQPPEGIAFYVPFKPFDDWTIFCSYLKMCCKRFL